MNTTITKVHLEQNQDGGITVLFEDGKRIQTEYKSFYMALRHVKTSHQEIFQLMTSEELEAVILKQRLIQGEVVLSHSFINGVSMAIKAECDPNDEEVIPHLRLESVLDAQSSDQSTVEFNNIQYFELSHRGYVQALNCLEEYIKTYVLTEQNIYSGYSSLTDIKTINELRQCPLSQEFLLSSGYKQHEPLVSRKGHLFTYTKKIRDAGGQYKYSIHIQQYDFREFKHRMNLDYDFRFSCEVRFENTKHGISLNISPELYQDCAALSEVERVIERTYRMLECSPNND